jgi:hypothetical protein
MSSCSVRDPLEPAEAWEMLWRPEGKRLWLAEDMALETRVGGRVIQSLEGLPWRSGVVAEWKEKENILLMLDIPTSWKLVGVSQAMIRLMPSAKKYTTIQIEESGVPIDRIPMVNGYWMMLLTRI